MSVEIEEKRHRFINYLTSKTPRLVLMSHGENDRKAAADDENDQFHGTKLSVVVMRLNFGKNVYGGDEEKCARTEKHGQTGGVH